MKVTSVDEILKRFLSNVSISCRQKKIVDEWSEIVGEEVARHLKIREISGKELHLSADHPGWIQVGNFRKREFLNKIKKDFPDDDIEDIKIFLR